MQYPRVTIWGSCLCLLFVCGSAAGQTIVYVDDNAPAGGDGTSWATAFRFLKDADGTNREVRVAGGRYWPDRTESNPDGTGNVGSKFSIGDNTSYIGGYAGLADPDDPDQRNVNLWPSILDGDLGENDEPDFIFYEDNSTNVVSLRILAGTPSVAVIDGFTIRGGNARDGERGGAIKLNAYISPDYLFIIRNCTFLENMSTGNGANGPGGGAVMVEPIQCCPAGWVFEATVIIDRCKFLGNHTDTRGGGLCIWNGGAIVTNCLFSGNSAGNAGGGAAVTLNVANFPPDNNATPDPTEFINCTFYGNFGQFGAGAIRYFNAHEPWASIKLKLYNSIIGGNAPGDNQVSADPGLPGEIIVSYVNAYDADANPLADGVSGSPVFSIPPLYFVDPDGDDDIMGTLDDDYHIFDPDISTPDDTVIDIGNNDLVPPDAMEDLDGTFRILDGDSDGTSTVDLGAYEYDEGCPACPGARVWIEPLGGGFHDHVNWDIGVPLSIHPVTFNLPDIYSVFFNGVDAESHELNMVDGEVTFDMGGAIYELFEGAAPGIVVGRSTSDIATITLTGGGELAGQIVHIGSEAFATGTMNVEGSSLFAGDNLCVGCLGNGTLNVTQGGLVTSLTADIGDLPGSLGTVLVSGPGSQWSIPFFVIIRDGTLTVENEGLVTAGNGMFGGLFLFPGGQILGDGFIEGIVVNFGELNPGLSPGTMTVLGDYFQVGELPDFGPSAGSLNVEIAGPEPDLDYDVLEVTGAAALGGGLFIELLGGYEPSVGDTFDIVSSPVIDSGFDVAFMPGLAEGRFMRLGYGTAGLNQAATIIVENLESLFGFEDPQSATIDGLPTGVVVGDFDPLNQNGPDLAISTTSPGSVLVLLNAGTDGLGNWLGFASSTQTFVGNDLSGITAGRFDADTELDVAVTNRDGNNVFVLLNSGAGDGSFGPEIEFAVGSEPSALAAADLTINGLVDLVVANAGDDNLHILVNQSGNADFAFSELIPVGGSPWAVDPSDIDNDKDIDAMIAVNRASDDASVVMVLGGGNFAPPVNINVGDAPLDIASADLDNDGFKDFVTANAGDDSGGAGTVSVVLNNGDDTFAPAVNLPVGDLPRSLTTIDLEGDGDDDIAIVANNDDGERVVQVLRNDLSNGQLIFADAAELAAGENPALVTAGDLDGDAHEDLITLNEELGLPAAAGAQPANAKARLGNPCPWDCGFPADDEINVVDFLAMLAQWGMVGETCDFDGNGVDIADFLAMLANWGPCP